jgi:allantoate deiminase
MIVAAHLPAAMLLVRSPGGVSHHPDERVIDSDIAAAIAVGRELLFGLARRLV